MSEILRGKLDINSFYVIKDEKIRQIIVNTNMNLPYKVIKADGYFLLLPNWYENSNKAERLDWANLINYREYIYGAIISFHKSEYNYKDHVTLAKGWCASEDNGTWTDGDTSIFFLQLKKNPDSNLLLSIEATPYINIKHQILDADVFVNDKLIRHLNYNLDSFSKNKQIEPPTN